MEGDLPSPAGSAGFPFAKIRAGQREMARDVAECIAAGEHLVAHAPTGIGKTAAAVVPAAQWAAKEGRTVFFLTPKHSQHRIAIETLKLLKSKADVRVVSADFIGKKWMCQVSGVMDLSSRDFFDYCLSVRKDEICPFYNRTFKKSQPTSEARQAVETLLSRQPLHVEEAIESCKNACPYEVMCLAAKKSNFLVCDYYHIFNPSASTSFFFKTEKTLENAVVIVDEAHNLPDRLRETLSNNISEIGLKRAERELSEFGRYDLADILEQLHGKVLALAKKIEQGKGEALLSRAELCEAVESCAGSKTDEFAEKLKEVSDEIRQKQRKSAAGGISGFLSDWLGPEEGFVRTVSRRFTRAGKPFVTVKYQCLDPSVASAPVIDEARSVILMSGTLVPTKMYAEVLGLPQDKTRVKQYVSSFPQENRMNLICTGVTSRYSVRGEAQYRKMADICSRVIEATPGSVAVFFPSYGLKEALKPYLSIRVPVFDEQKEMKKKEKSDFFKGFCAQKKAALLGVTGGSLSEGVDYPRNVLKAVVVVGLPLEQPSLEVNALVDYYQKKFGRGWDYGYLFPAIARSIQAAGRMIRSETDRGVAVFLDERYSWANYRKCFPPELKTIVTADPLKFASEFWEG